MVYFSLLEDLEIHVSLVIGTLVLKVYPRHHELEAKVTCSVMEEPFQVIVDEER